MRRQHRLSRGLSLVTLLTLISHVAAHSWVQRIMRIAPNGTMVGTPGYARGQESPTMPGYNENTVTGLIPPNGRPTGNEILTTDLIARPAQTTLNYSTEFPMMSAAPGDWVALQYQENGHVTLPMNQVNKTLNRGTVYVYGTMQNDLSSTTLVQTHLKWNSDGTGGNAQGRLLATRNFDDGQCYQINSGNISQFRQKVFPKTAEDPMGTNLWCQTDINLPSNLTVGSIYTVIWLWDWPGMTEDNVPVSPAYIKGYGNSSSPTDPQIFVSEYYASVVDFKIVDPCDASLGAVKGPSCGVANGTTTHAATAMSFIPQINLNVGSVYDQLHNAFQVDLTQSTGGDSDSTETSEDIPANLPASVVLNSVAALSAGGGQKSTSAATSAMATGGASTSASAVTSSTSAGGDVAGGKAVVTVTVPAATVTVTVTADDETSTQSASVTSRIVSLSTSISMDMASTSTSRIVSSSTAPGNAGTDAAAAAHPTVTPFTLHRVRREPRRHARTRHRE